MDYFYLINADNVEQDDGFAYHWVVYRFCIADSLKCIIIHQKGIEKQHQAFNVSNDSAEKNGLRQANVYCHGLVSCFKYFERIIILTQIVVASIDSLKHNLVSSFRVGCHNLSNSFF